MSQAPVVAIRSFERAHIVGLRESGLTYRRTAARVGHNVSVVCRFFRAGLWNLPTPVDQLLDGRVVKAQVKIDKLCEQQWPHPGTKSGHMLYVLSPRTIWNSLSAAGLRSRKPLVRLPLTPRHFQLRILWCHERIDWRVQWRPVVFGDKSRFCLYASDERTRVRCRPAFAHNTQAPPQASRCVYIWVLGRVNVRGHWLPSGFVGLGGITIYNSRSLVVFLQGKVNSARYIALAVSPMLLSFIRQEGAVPFQQDSASPHMAAATCSSWCTTTALASKNPRSLANSTRMGHDETGTYSFSRACHNNCRIATTGARCSGKSIAV